MAKKANKEVRVGVKGSAKLACVNTDGSLAWETPWYHNVITNIGFQDYICKGIVNTTGASHISYMALGTGTNPNVTHVTLPNEISNTAGAVTRNTFSIVVTDSKTLRLYATFASGSNSFFSATGTGIALQNIGLYEHSSSAGGLFSGLTYATQAVQSNQQVNATYQLSFATA